MGFMGYLKKRYDILITDESKVMNLDFVITPDDRKLIHGIVWDDSINPKKIKDAIIAVFKAGPNYNEDPNDISPIGYAFSDANGEFLIGPFKSGESIIIQISKFKENGTGSDTGYSGYSGC
ncbi:hypothetical protein RI065_02990 [Mycoplasmatota bacterium zrk1]